MLDKCIVCGRFTKEYKIAPILMFTAVTCCDYHTDDDVVRVIENKFSDNRFNNEPLGVNVR